MAVIMLLLPRLHDDMTMMIIVASSYVCHVALSCETIIIGNILEHQHVTVI